MFSPGTNEADARKAQDNLESAHAALAQARAQAYFAARQAYWKAHLAMYQLAVAGVAEACAQRIFELTKDQYDHEPDSIKKRYKQPDVSQAATKWHTLQVATADATNNEEQAQDALNVALNCLWVNTPANCPSKNGEKIRPDKPRTPPTAKMFKDLLPPVEDFARLAVRARPEIAQQEAAGRAAEEDLNKAALGLGRPTYTVTVGPQLAAQGVFGQTWPLGFPTQWVAQAQMTLPISDGGATPAKIDAQRQALQLTQRKLRLLLEYTIEQQVRAAHVALRTAVADYAHAVEARADAKAAFDQTLDLYSHPDPSLKCNDPKAASKDCKTLFDVLTTFNDATAALTPVEKAQTDYEIAEAQLRQAVGCDWPIGGDGLVHWKVVAHDGHDEVQCDQPYLQPLGRAALTEPQTQPIILAAATRRLQRSAFTLVWG